MHQDSQQQFNKEVLQKMIMGSQAYFEDCISAMKEQDDEFITDGREDYTITELVLFCKIINEIEKYLNEINEESISIVIKLLDKVIGNKCYTA